MQSDGTKIAASVDLLYQELTGILNILDEGPMTAKNVDAIISALTRANMAGSLLQHLVLARYGVSTARD